MRLVTKENSPFLGQKVFPRGFLQHTLLQKTYRRKKDSLPAPVLSHYKAAEEKREENENSAKSFRNRAPAIVEACSSEPFIRFITVEQHAGWNRERQRKRKRTEAGPLNSCLRYRPQRNRYSTAGYIYTTRVKLVPIRWLLSGVPVCASRDVEHYFRAGHSRSRVERTTGPAESSPNLSAHYDNTFSRKP